MASQWRKAETIGFSGLIKKIKRERWFVHSKDSSISLCMKYPVTLIPDIFNIGSYEITVYKNGKQIGERCVGLPEYSLEHIMILKAQEMVK